MCTCFVSVCRADAHRSNRLRSRRLSSSVIGLRALCAPSGSARAPTRPFRVLRTLRGQWIWPRRAGGARVVTGTARLRLQGGPVTVPARPAPTPGQDAHPSRASVRSSQQPRVAESPRATANALDCASAQRLEPPSRWVRCSRDGAVSCGPRSLAAGEPPYRSAVAAQREVRSTLPTRRCFSGRQPRLREPAGCAIHQICV